MITMKTISGHYGSVYDLDHNNRTFIPKNCVVERLHRNYYPVMTGCEVPFELPDMRFSDEMWDEYHRLVTAYWQDRGLAKTEEYEQLKRKLRELQQYRFYWCLDDCGVFGLTIGLLFLPLIIAKEITIARQYDEAIEVWEHFQQEQFARDMMFLAQKNSLRDTLRSYDMQSGTDTLCMMDSTVKDMARLAGDLVNASDKYVSLSVTKPRFATLEEIYDKLYDPAFQAFQAKQRPCRRYDGTYLEYIREQERKEIQKKAQNKNSRNRKMTEAFEIVFSIGDMDNTGYNAAWSDAMKSEELLKDFCDHLLQKKNICFVTTKELEEPGWQPPFNNGLLVLSLSMHGDESTPGVHLTCIPYSRNCKRGPAVQPSVSRAFAGMGYPSTWKEVLDKNGNSVPKKDRNGEIIHNKDGSVRYKKEPDGQGVLDWIEDQKGWIQNEMLKRYGWDREYKGSHPRGDLSIPDYKVARAEERRKEIERQIDTMMISFMQRTNEQIDRLNETVDYVWQDTHEWNSIIRYLKTCSEEEYEKLYKRARDFLDNLPQQEKLYAKKTLDEIISLSKDKHNFKKGKTIDHSCSTHTTEH